jgi:hypothetical protein
LMRCEALLGVAGVILLTSSAVAQSMDTTASDVDAPCTPGVSSYVENPVIGASDVPYSATLKVTFDRRLSDGHAIHGVTWTLNARDSSGKARTETSTGCWRDKEGHPTIRLNVRVADPVAGTVLEWNTGGAVLKVARLLYQPEAFSRSEGFPEWRISEKSLKVPGEPDRIVRTELLGTKIIDGIEVHGLKTIITMPRDEKSGGAVVVETREQWISIELGIVMTELVDDPVYGRTEMEMENFSLKEPVPALFLPPDGYTIVEQYPNGVRR